MRLVVSSSSYSSIFGCDEGDEILHILLEAVVGLVLQPADAEGVRRQPRAAIFFENLENFFAVAKGVEQRRDGANVERMRSQPELVAGNAVQLGQNDADVLRPRRRFHVQQLFDCFAISQPVRDRRHVIHAVHVGIEHRVGAVLGNFLDARGAGSR